MSQFCYHHQIAEEDSRDLELVAELAKYRFLPEQELRQVLALEEEMASGLDQVSRKHQREEQLLRQLELLLGLLLLESLQLDLVLEAPLLLPQVVSYH